jgi:8-oxo-dGTP pyrophosphatase MutT (NUDIX family)
MPVEKSAGAVIFRREKDNILFLLLRYSSGLRTKKPRSRASSLRGREYWGFSKGHIEKGENIYETITREVKEETGINDLNIIKGFKEFENYFFKVKEKTIFKTVIFLLAETKEKEIELSSEHTGFKWLPYEEALKRLTFQNAKKILKKANDFISGKNI